MDTKIEETISELYALRAGLSVVSQCADVVRDYEKDVAELDTNNAEGNKAIKLGEDEYKKKIKACEEFEKEIPNKVAKDLNKTYCDIYDILKYFLCIAALPFIMGVIVLIVGMLYGLLLFIVPILFLLLFLATRPPRKRKFIEKTKRKYQSELENMRAEAQEFRQALDKGIIELNDAMNKSNSTKNDCLQIIQNKSNECKVYNSALVTQYGKFLSTADWKNVDLLIFYLETGRADTMKEALQLADRQRQTDAIVHEIRRAGECIRAEISGGFAKLGVAMGRCFAELSRQISVQHNEVLASLKESGRTLENISSSVELNNALQEKANVSCDQLQEDLIYMQKRIGIRS